MRRRERGSAFLLALAGTVLLAGSLAALASTQRAIQRETINRLARSSARRAAESGLARAVAEIMSDRGPNAAGAATTGAAGGPAEGNTAAVTLADPWATFGGEGAQRFLVGDATFRVRILDASSLLDVNTVTEAELGRLPLTQDQIDSLLDYRTPGQEQRASGGKDPFYNGLARPYNASLRRLETVDELLLVREWTPDILWRPQTNVSSIGGTSVTQDGETPIIGSLLTATAYAPQTGADGTARINVNTLNNQPQRLIQAGVPAAVAVTIAARNNWTLSALITQFGAQPAVRTIILDRFTTNGALRREGLVNINTAPEAVLLALGLPPDATRAVLDRQSTGFTRLSELAEIPGVTNEVLAPVADRVTTSSSTFVVRVVGTEGAATVSLEAVVDIQKDRPKILSISDAPFDDMPTRWNWPAETSTETRLVEP